MVGSTTKNGYGWQWQKLRTRILSRDSYLCQSCFGLGRITPANEVDHITPKQKGGLDCDDNLQSLCKQCHQIKTAVDNGGQITREIGLDGWPIEGTEVVRRNPRHLSFMPDWFTPSQIPMTIVCGPPCAGKSTYVAQHAGANDLVICSDTIAKQMYGKCRGLSRDQWSPVIRRRNEILGSIMKPASHGKYRHVWLIGTMAKPDTRIWWRNTVKPVKIVLLAPSESECIARLCRDAANGDDRGKQAVTSIRTWFQDYRPLDSDAHE